MGMGNYPCQADTIEIEFVKEMCPQELNDFFVALDESGISREHFAQDFYIQQDDFENLYNITEEQDRNIKDAWERLL